MKIKVFAGHGLPGYFCTECNRQLKLNKRVLWHPDFEFEQHARGFESVPIACKFAGKKFRLPVVELEEAGEDTP